MSPQKPPLSPHTGTCPSRPCFAEEAAEAQPFLRVAEPVMTPGTGTAAARCSQGHSAVTQTVSHLPGRCGPLPLLGAELGCRAVWAPSQVATVPGRHGAAFLPASLLEEPPDPELWPLAPYPFSAAPSPSDYGICGPLCKKAGRKRLPFLQVSGSARVFCIWHFTRR